MYDADKPMLVGLILLISTLLGLLATGVLGGDTYLGRETSSTYARTVFVAGAPVRVEVANTPEKRVQGLSDRDRIAENQGMLFVFEESGRYPIWMRNMRFSLDVYWINNNGTIVDIWHNAHPESYPKIYEPSADAKYILEVVAGFSEVYNVEVGDTVTGLEKI